MSKNSLFEMYCVNEMSSFYPLKNFHFCVTFGDIEALDLKYAKPPVVNSLRPRQNGRHFADDVFKCIFLNENL